MLESAKVISNYYGENRASAAATHGYPLSSSSLRVLRREQLWPMLMRWLARMGMHRWLHGRGGVSRIANTRGARCYIRHKNTKIKYSYSLTVRDASSHVQIGLRATARS